MEIKTCEQYVLAELKRLQEENDALWKTHEEESKGWAGIVDDLNKKLAVHQKVIDFLKDRIELNSSDVGDRIVVPSIYAWYDEPMFVPLHDLYIEAGERSNEQ